MAPLANLWLAPVAPLLLLQGRRVRRAMPPLPEAAGPREDCVPGGAPRVDVLFLGESTIVGVGVTRMHDSLPAVTARELATRIGREVAWKAVGASGVTAASACALLEGARSPRRFSLAVVALGVSDTISLTPPAVFHAQMRRLLQLLGTLAGPVLLSGVPRVDGFRARLPQPLRLALGRRCRSLDGVLTRLSLERRGVLHWPVFLPPGANDTPQAFAEDGFHPGRAGYRLWSRHLALGAQTLLEAG